jgi:2'-5' RNA ligase
VPDSTGLTDKARVFFALWPEPDCQARCAEAAVRLQARHGGRKTRAPSVHLTLVFVGAVERAALPRLIEAGDAARGPAFRIDFDRAACWRHNHIVYLAPAEAPVALFDLVARLEQQLSEHGIVFDRRAYAPHVTLLRHAECRDPRSHPLDAPIAWSTREFVLVESRLAPEGSGYLPLARFSLS